MPVQLRISRWGNSLGLRVPRDVAARAGLKEGARVEIEGYSDGRIVVTPSKRRFTIEELVEGMKPESEPSEFMKDDWPVGDELI
jgi:antitoxin MazE